MTEYLPGFLPEAWRRRTQEEAVGLYSPGADAQALIDVRGVPIAVSICFETAFPLLMRATSRAAAVMVSITNDDWFMGTTMLRQDIVIARMRALEGGRPLLRVANSGITALIEHDGKLERELPVGVKSLLRADIQPRGASTPYWRFGDVPVVILSVTACLLVAAWRRKARRIADF
jgi:apolipoprotein N-acyltransferase